MLSLSLCIDLFPGEYRILCLELSYLLWIASQGIVDVWWWYFCFGFEWVELWDESETLAVCLFVFFSKVGSLNYLYGDVPWILIWIYLPHVWGVYGIYVYMCIYIHIFVRYEEDFEARMCNKMVLKLDLEAKCYFCHSSSWYRNKKGSYATQEYTGFIFPLFIF